MGQLTGMRRGSAPQRQTGIVSLPKQQRMPLRMRLPVRQDAAAKRARESKDTVPGQEDTLGRATRQSGARGSRRPLDATAEFAVMALRQGADLCHPGGLQHGQAHQRLADHCHAAASGTGAAMALRFLMAVMAWRMMVGLLSLIGLTAMVEQRSGCSSHLSLLLILAVRQHRGVLSRRASLTELLGHRRRTSMAGRAHQHGRRRNALNGNCQRQQPSQSDADQGVHTAIVKAAFERLRRRSSWRLKQQGLPQ